MFISAPSWSIKPPFGAQLNTGHPLARDLVGLWLFNETAGILSHDMTARQNNMTGVGSPGWKAVASGIAMDFSGSNYVMCNTTKAIPNPVSGNITLLVWAQLTVNGSQGIFSISLDSDEGNVGVLSIGNNSAGPFRAEGYGTDSAPSLVGTTTPSVGQLYQVAFARGVSDNVLYVNAVQEATNSTAPQSFTPVRIHAGTYNVNYGRMNGQVFYAAIWARGLSSAEIYRLYKDPFVFMTAALPRRYYDAVAGGGDTLFAQAVM